MSQSQIPAIGNEFPIVKSFKKAVQQDVKAAGFTFSISSSKMSRVGKVNHTLFVTLQCIMRASQYKTKRANSHDAQKNALNENFNHNITVQLLQMLEKHQYVVHHTLSKDDHIQNLFFTYIKAARQMTICSEMLMVDTTYKTNLYKLFLINIVGISNIDNVKVLNTYQIAMAWIANK
ncbi:1112_t:CDS:2 [Ambispora gerdemannii]|uniref:1112_t:CDS:1 n=1 Tax=Ambispora gerdemannii TaxID=144530 RepID=A0A9N9EER6_9GLOM|nr:1112_t:CDS:2 [Ambispora gerdemannii]